MPGTGQLIVLGLIVVPLCVWAVVSPRTLRARLPHAPDANEPGKAAYMLVRFGALFPIAALITTAILVAGAGKRDQQVIHGVLLREVFPVSVVGYSHSGSDRHLAVVLRTDGKPCHVEVMVADESVTELEINPMLMSESTPWSTPCSDRSTTTVPLILDHPLGARTVVTRAPRLARMHEDRWRGPLHVVPKS